ncbi:MAG: choice-of-anchor D domain-containing protein [Myxococcaceae bacterium]
MMSWRGWAAVVVAVTSVLTGCRDPGLNQAPRELRIEPEEIDFGPVALGREAVVEMTLTNQGRSSFRVDELLASVPNVRVDAFEPFSLSSGESRTFKAVFSPTVAGRVDGAFSITTDLASEPSHVTLAGIGVKSLVSIVNQRIDFGRVELETTVVQNVTAVNTSNVVAPLRFTIEGSDIDQFSSSLANGQMLLEPGEEKQIPIAFQPIRLGLASAQLRFEVCHGCEPVTVELTGEGSRGDLDIFPTRVDFGRVALGATAEITVTILNAGTEDVDWKGAELTKTSTVGVFQIAFPSARVLRSGESVTVTVHFSPTSMGPQSAHLYLDVIAKNATRGVTLPVKGEGGVSCVAVLPRSLDFGTVPEGMSATKSVDVLNRCASDVTLLELHTSTTSGGFFSLAQMPAAKVIPVGAIEKLKVTFTPKPGEPDSEGALTLRFQEGSAISTQQVPLVGKSKVFAPCTASFLPGQLDFGAVPVGAEVTLGMALRNDGAEQCFIGGMQLAAGSDAAFTANELPSDILDPGEKAVLMVKFKPMALGTFSALSEAWINHPSQNHPTAPITGRAIQGCFHLQPRDLDWGTRKLTCAPVTLAIEGTNGCSAAVTLSSAELDAPATTEFSLLNPLPATTVLNPGQRTTFVVRYTPVDDGPDSAALRVTADGVEHTAGLRGTGLNSPTRTDLFVQDSLAKVDVLFVIDNSGSMMEEQNSIGQNFAAFLQAAQSQSVDYHIAVTTTGIDSSPGGWSVCPGGAEGGEGGRLFPVDGSSPRIITPQTPNALGVFANNVKVGVCHWNEQGLEAAYRALSAPLVSSTDDPSTSLPGDGNGGFLRPEAKLAIVFLSDENDYSPNALNDDVTFYETFFKAVKGNDTSMLSISAIVGPQALGSCPTASSAGIRYIKLAQATGGVVESICTANWARSLTDIGANTFGPRRVFPLQQRPDDPNQIVVEVNGVQVTSGWRYDPATNSIEFTSTAVPPAGSVIQITYPLGC